MEKKELIAILEERPSRLLELADEGERARSIELLWGLALDEKEPKPVRKTAKKALYMLKSGGADVERLRPAAAPKAPEAEEGPEESVSESYLSLPDSSMSVLLLFVVSGGGAASRTLIRAVAHPERGITNLSSGGTSKRQLEKYLGQNPDVFRVPVEYALFRFRRALQRTDGAGVPGLESLPSLMRGGDGGEVRHPVLALAGSTASRILRPEEESTIFSRREVARLALVGEDVPRCRELVREARQSRLIVGNRSPEERVEAVIDGFVSSHFTRERREIYAEALFDIALYFTGAAASGGASGGMTEEARTLVDYGRELLYAGPSLKDHPIVRFLVYKEFLLER